MTEGAVDIKYNNRGQMIYDPNWLAVGIRRPVEQAKIILTEQQEISLLKDRVELLEQQVAELRMADIQKVKYLENAVYNLEQRHEELRRNQIDMVRWRNEVSRVPIVSNLVDTSPPRVREDNEEPRNLEPL